jgi:DNA replication initiation complex subunit (GINS family)
VAEDIKVTYETLFELLRLEKGREELQELSKTFFSDVGCYISEKEQLLKATDQQPANQERVTTQLENIRRIVRELYDKREKKIILMALNKSRTGSDIIDISQVLDEERPLFEALLTVLDQHRGSLLHPTIKGLKVEQKEEQQPKTKAPEPKKDTQLIRFTKPVPKFVGPHLEVYGPFEEEDMANLPLKIAELLIKKGRATSMD